MTDGESPQTNTEEPQGEQTPSPASDENILRRVLIEFSNWTLLPDSLNAFKDTDWYAVSLTTLSVGFLGLVVWSAYMLLILGITHVTSAQSILNIGSRVSSLISLVPVLVFVFAMLSNRAAQGMRTAYSEDQPTDPPILLLGTVSIVAFVTAGTYRWALYQALHQLFGTTPTALNVVSILIVDGLHLSLLLVGFGGIGTLIFAPAAD